MLARLGAILLAAALMHWFPGLASAQGGSISGRIIDASSGQPIADAEVQAGRLWSLPMGPQTHFIPQPGAATTTDLDGRFWIHDLPADTALTIRAHKYLHVRGILGGAICPPSAPAQSAAPCQIDGTYDHFTVTPGSLLTLDNLALAPAASLIGQLVAAESGTAIGGSIQLRPNATDASFEFANGAYQLDHIPLGLYHPLATAEERIVTGIDGQPCGWYNHCEEPAALSLATPGLYPQDFTLPLAARIDVSATSDGVPVLASCRLFREDLPTRPSHEGVNQHTNLPAGTYTLLLNPDDFVPQYYDGLPCPDEACTGVVPTPITLAAGEARQIAQVLQPMRSIRGRVIDDHTGAPLAGVTVSAVRFLRPFGGLWHMSFVDLNTTDDDGEFVLAGLPEAALDLVTSNTRNYVDVRYPSLSCQPHDACHPDTGHGHGHFQIGPDTHVSGVEIRLKAGSRIAGEVRLPGQHHSAAQVRISHVDNPHFTINTHVEDGQYTTYTGLIPGPYFVQVGTVLGRQIYNGISCVDEFLDCPTELATPVLVSGSDSIHGIDFDFTDEGDLLFVSGFE